MSARSEFSVPGLPIAPFAADFAPDDRTMVEAMLARNSFTPELRGKIRQRAEKFVETIRNTPANGGLEEFMQEYSLSTKEGLALMVLAEALLRVPDAQTQNRLIEEKLSQGEWKDDGDGDESWLLMMASFGIRTSSWVLKPGETPAAVVKAMVKRLGVPVIRTGVRQAMQYLGHHFVLGQTIEAGLKRAVKQEAKGYRYSYDMLGEGARTSEDAARYYKAYEQAIEFIGKAAQKRDSQLPDRPGISVKLSAIHPRYDMRHYDRVMGELVPDLLALAQKAKAYNLNFTVDAEEADRLELSLDVFGVVAADASLAGWDGFGLAIQAYQKRAPQVIDWVLALAEKLDRKFMVRLVKGAYWDSELKRAQERGLDGFPVFTKKAVTDLCYIDCARALLEARPRLFPQFATHNALTLATILVLADMGDEKAGFEFQRLHGMGEALYEAELGGAGIAARIYAPVGGYKDLLAYLVRRLLENSANSSFVAQVADEDVAMDDLLQMPQQELRALLKRGEEPVHRHVRLPREMFDERYNSRGREAGLRVEMARIEQAIEQDFTGIEIGSLIGGEEKFSGPVSDLCNPAGAGGLSGHWHGARQDDVAAAFAIAQRAYGDWNGKAVGERAEILRRFADLLEGEQDRFLGLLTREAGKTFDDGIAEIREAVDFCRYYASKAEELAGQGGLLPGPVGERNQLQFSGRGVFVCISPWNFPLAIFLGQISAALVTGNCVIAKPAEQTPFIAHEAIKLFYKAGLPQEVCALVLGDGEIGGWLTGHDKTAGVVFTGSTQVAKIINRALAAKDGAIVPLIAETGGINAMIVDSTALPEQVTDDVIASAFKSAGQRCSALRLLFLQEDIADDVLHMIIGAAKELVIGNPAKPCCDVGPVIDEQARAGLLAHIAAMESQSRVVYRGQVPEDLGGTFVAPTIIELDDPAKLTREAFGPVLHVVRWQAKELDKAIAAINEKGFGLTFGLHSRLENLEAYVVPRLHAGNIYVNRNTVGAVVGVQPFGGMGLSGTGPKAGGPLYLTRFVEEKTVTVNTAAAGGNASLIAMED